MGVAWSEERLFAVEPIAALEPDVDAPRLSATRRLTARNNARLAAGTHPVSGYPLLAGPFVEGPIQSGPSCGTCDYLTAHGHNARTYYKCGLVVATGGPGTDIRLRWPACTRWQALA